MYYLLASESLSLPAMDKRIIVDLGPSAMHTFCLVADKPLTQRHLPNRSDDDL